MKTRPRIKVTADEIITQSSVVWLQQPAPIGAGVMDVKCAVAAVAAVAPPKPRRPPPRSRAGALPELPRDVTVAHGARPSGSSEKRNLAVGPRVGAPGRTARAGRHRGDRPRHCTAPL